MSKRQILILLGIWFGVFLFLGLPEGWHTILAAISGLVLIVIAYSLKSEPAKNAEGSDVTYVEEHKPSVVVSAPTPTIPTENSSVPSDSSINNNPTTS